jgi:DNA mismatch endonuclease (patch repair protein)
VFPRLRKIIFVHGCFWHQHDGCRFAYKPKSNSTFWSKKFSENIARDQRAICELQALGWVFWSCGNAELGSQGPS